MEQYSHSRGPDSQGSSIQYVVKVPNLTTHLSQRTFNDTAELTEFNLRATSQHRACACRNMADNKGAFVTFIWSPLPTSKIVLAPCFHHCVSIWIDGLSCFFCAPFFFFFSVLSGGLAKRIPVGWGWRGWRTFHEPIDESKGQYSLEVPSCDWGLCERVGPVRLVCDS